MNGKVIKYVFIVLITMSQIMRYDSIFQVIFPIILHEYVKIKKIEAEYITGRINNLNYTAKNNNFKKYSNLEKYLLSKLKEHYIGK